MMGLECKLYCSGGIPCEAREGFRSRPKANEDLSFRFVIGTAVRDCAQTKNVLRLCASPQGPTR